MKFLDQAFSLQTSSSGKRLPDSVAAGGLWEKPAKGNA
jgi:hypothetical protein